MWLSFTLCPCPIKLGRHRGRDLKRWNSWVFNESDLHNCFTSSFSLSSELRYSNSADYSLKLILPPLIGMATGQATTLRKERPSWPFNWTQMTWTILMMPSWFLCTSSATDRGGKVPWLSLSLPPLLYPRGNWGCDGFREALARSWPEQLSLARSWPIWTEASLFICGTRSHHFLLLLLSRARTLELELEPDKEL